MEPVRKRGQRVVVLVGRQAMSGLAERLARELWAGGAYARETSLERAMEMVAGAIRAALDEAARVARDKLDDSGPGFGTYDPPSFNMACEEIAAAIEGLK